MRGDVREKADWLKALEGIDSVIHLAAYMDYHLDFSTYIDVNLKSLALLFECIEDKKLSITKIIMASSQSVYGEGKFECEEHGLLYLPPRSEARMKKGDWEQHCPVCGQEVKPLPEREDDELHPNIPYAISKWASEKLLMTLGRQYRIPGVALRYSIVLGPRQSFRHYYSGALRAFAANVLDKEAIQMNEDAGQIRDFVHVQDVARAHLCVLEDEKANFEVFNVGSGERTRVLELAERVAKEAAVPFEPKINNRYRVGGSRHALMNIDKLRSLGWEPRFGLEDMVHDYMQWITEFENVSSILRVTEKTMREQGLLKEIQ